MRNRIFLFINVFLYFTLIFLLEKILFLLMPVWTAGAEITTDDILAVIYKGLPLDLAMSGYLSIFPLLLIILSIWIRPNVISKICNIYFAVVLLAIAAIAVIDIMVYPQQGQHIDASVLTYVEQPQETLKDILPLNIIIATVTILATTVLLYLGYNYTIKMQILKLEVPKNIGKTILVLFAFTVLLGTIIKGGKSIYATSTQTTYSYDRVFLNHAGMNSQFYFLSSLKNKETSH